MPSSKRTKQISLTKVGHRNAGQAQARPYVCCSRDARAAAASPHALLRLQTCRTRAHARSYALALVRLHTVRSARHRRLHGSVTVTPPAPQVKKQGRKRKEAIVETILECLDAYTHVYVYSMDNMRTSIIKGM